MNRETKKTLSFAAWGLALVLANAASYTAVFAAKMRWADDSTPPLTVQAGAIMVGGFILMTGLTAFYVWLHRETVRKGGPLFFAALALLSAALFAFSILGRPVGSVDNYWNTLMSRGWTVHGRNPYLTTPSDLATDPIFPLTAVEWRGTAMMYGPLWVIASALPTWLLRQPDAALIGMKILVSLGYAGAGLLLFAYLRRRGNRNANVFLSMWLLSPMGMFEVANAGHNEGLLVLPLAVLAIGLAEKRPQWALPGLTGAALIKIWPLILLPALFGLRKAPLREWLKGAGLSALLCAAFVFFWDGWRIFEPLIGRLDGSVSRYYSPGFALLWRLIRLPGAADEQAALAARVILGAGLLITCFVAGLLAARGRLSPLGAVRLILIFFMFMALPWLQPWYLVALWPFFLPRPDDLGGAITILVLMTTAIMAFLSYMLAWDAAAVLCLGPAACWSVVRQPSELPRQQPTNRP